MEHKEGIMPDRQVTGEFTFDRERGLSFTCHSHNEDFELTKEALKAVRNHVEQQLRDEHDCPFSHKGGANRMRDVSEFDYFLGQRVEIVAIQAEGVVTGRTERQTHLKMYQVVYWIDGQRKEDWLYSHELTYAKEKSK